MLIDRYASEFRVRIGSITFQAQMPKSCTYALNISSRIDFLNPGLHQIRIEGISGCRDLGLVLGDS